MNWIDYTSILIVSFSVIIGMFRGFAREVVSLLVWIGGILLTLHHLADLETQLMSWIGSMYLRYAVIIVISVSSILVVSWLIGKMLRLAVSSAGLGFVDRIFGFVFGFVRGVVIVAFLVATSAVNQLQTAPELQESLLIPAVQPMAIWLSEWAPNMLSTQFSAPAQVELESEEQF